MKGRGQGTCYAPPSKVGLGVGGEKFREKLGGKSKKFVFIGDS